MQPIKTYLLPFLLSSILVLVSCSEPATAPEKNEKDSTTLDTAEAATYDPASDPFTTAGANAKLFKDTLGIKFFEAWLKPGELAPIHRHPDHAIYVLQGGKVMLYSKDFPGAENGLPIEFKTGEGWVGGPVTDSARNIGTTTIRLLEVDVYRPRSK